MIAEGESVRGPIPPTGNTNTRGFFKPDVRTFLTRWVAEGPTHHFALGIGRHARTITEDRRRVGHRERDRGRSLMAADDHGIQGYRPG